MKKPIDPITIDPSNSWDILQGGPLLVINGVISLINGLIIG